MTLSTARAVRQLDMPDYVGQRSATFRFQLLNAVTGDIQGDLHPISNAVPTLTHDTSRTIKRQIQGLFLGVADTRRVSAIQSRVLVSMIIAGEEWPLGRYMYSDKTDIQTTAGDLSSGVFYDEMFIVDQQLEHGYAAITQQANSSNPIYTSMAGVILALTAGLPITVEIEPSPFYSIASWQAGTTRGSAIEQTAIDGDWFSPWFDNAGVMQFIRTFDPATQIPTFDLDVGNRVYANTIFKTNDLITAANRFIVIANAAVSTDSTAQAVVGRYDVPASAPHSISSRGFVIPSVTERQIDTPAQANAVAANIGIRQTVFERVELSTPPDPRHDSYDVIHWNGDNWLELAWSLPLIEGAAMTHVMRKAYS
jgi:hypothetical protein